MTNTRTKMTGLLIAKPKKIGSALVCVSKQNIFNRATFAVRLNNSFSFFSSKEKAEAFALFMQEGGTMAERFSKLFISSEMDDSGNFGCVFNADPVWFGAKVWIGSSWDEIDFLDGSSITAWVNNGSLNTCVMPIPIN